MEPMLAIVLAAAVMAGALNAVAGGGSFLSFPALLLAGVPPIPANATNAVALWPASLASVAGYREHLTHTRRELLLFGAVSLAEGLLGALLLLLTPERTFARLIPWLLAAATLLFALGPGLTRRLRARHLHAPPAAIVLVQLAVAVYGGYFGGGMGILMLAALAALGMEDVHAMNGLKAILGTAINGIAAVSFIVAGVIAWHYAIPMIVAASAGGYAGARLARRVDPRHVRGFVIAVGLGLSGYFFIQG